MPRRRQYFIKKKFQIHFLYRFVILLFIEALLIVGLFACISSDTLTTGYSNSTLTIARTPYFFLMPLLLIILITAVGIGLAGMAVFILLSHRIAGPLYRFEKTLKEVEAGELRGRIHLRRTDQLEELKEALNVLVHSLDTRVSRVKYRLMEAQTLLSRKDDPDSLAKLRKVIDLLEQEMGHFKATPRPKE